MRQLLFLCTANYYRSRFAELLFNSLATGAQLDWRAVSRGLATELGIHNVGPISPLAVQGLRARGIEIGPDIRLPLPVQLEDFTRADLVVAMDEIEHRPFMMERYPAWAGRIEYWRVADLHAAPMEKALALAETEIRALIARFRSSENDLPSPSPSTLDCGNAAPV